MLNIPISGGEDWFPFACKVHVPMDVNRAPGSIKSAQVLEEELRLTHIPARSLNTPSMKRMSAAQNRRTPSELCAVSLIPSTSMTPMLPLK